MSHFCHKIIAFWYNCCKHISSTKCPPNFQCILMKNNILILWWKHYLNFTKLSHTILVTKIYYIFFSNYHHIFNTKSWIFNTNVIITFSSQSSHPIFHCIFMKRPCREKSKDVILWWICEITNCHGFVMKMWFQHMLKINNFVIKMS